MMDNNSQKVKILAYMFLHEEGITPIEALNEFGCMRLGARIWELKHKHQIPVEKKDEVVVTKDGTTKRYARYYIKKGE